MNTPTLQHFGTAAIALVAIAASGCHKAAPADEATPKPQVQVELSTVSRRTMHDALNVTGTISPLPDQESKVAPLAPGRVSKIFVNLGDHVTKGEPVAQLDPGPLQGQYQQSLAVVHSAEETLTQAKLNYPAQTHTQSSAITQAEQNVSAQRVALNKLIAGSRPQEVAQAQANVASAQAALTNAEQNLGRSQTLFAEGLIARKDLESAQAQRASAAAALNTAQQALSPTRAGNRPQDIEAGRIALRQAEEQLRAARAASIQNSVKAQDVQIAQRQLMSAQGALKAAQAQLGATTIKAPVAGTVVARTVNPGEWVDTAGSVCTIANINVVRVVMNVPSAQVGKVREGQTVEFASDSNRNRTYTASVITIGKAIDPATNTVTVEARAANPDNSLRDDTFVRGRLLLNVHPDVTIVPTGAVVEKNGEAIVFTVGSDNVAHAVKVTPGFQEGGFTEVSGVKVGDRVVTTGAYELEDGTTVRPAQAEQSSP